MNITNDYIEKLDEDVKDSISTNFAYIGFGTGTTSFSPSDTALESEVIRKARQEITESGGDTTTVSGYLSLAEANGNTIGEVGTFDLSSNGSMQVRFVLNTPIEKTPNKEFWFDISMKRTVEEQ